MPGAIVLHEGNSFALDGAGDHRQRLAGRGLQRIDQCGYVMAVDRPGSPAEALPLGWKISMLITSRVAPSY